MTCIALKVEKSGYDKALSTGELIDFRGKDYVIIYISEVRTYQFLNSPYIEATVVGQEVGSDNPQDRYFPKSPTKTTFKKGTDDNGFMAKMTVGKLMASGNGIVAIVTKINKVDYSFVDVIVEYEIKSIIEWSQHEIDKAVKLNRISKFKVISGGKNE